MNVLIITAHPEADSFNSYLASKAARIFEKQGSRVHSVNLYRAVAGAECNTVIELKPEHHAA
ncbi:NAD(P)H-dependent oxidoreductase [Pseudomonas aeruginosa]|nr:NAD(P)H-dependent oxidoreductase [Pseudomonas aeruginosa]MCV4078956.1 NAD(P)H-dependent oxidoreductase [Pseudomonas aeruginosa]